MKTLNKKPLIIGMIHLLPMPGYLNHPGMDIVIRHALKDLDALQQGGIHAVLIENDMDKPHNVKATPEVITAMTIITRKIVENSSCPIGVEVLLNDPKASLAIAYLSDADFIRTDYFVDRMSREEYGGEMEIDPVGLMEYRKKLGAGKVKILTDIQVKYAQLLENDKTIKESAKQAADALTDGIIVTGDFTGQQPQYDHIKEAKSTTKEIPVLVGSGFSKENAVELLRLCDGAIVGTSIKSNNSVDLLKVKELMEIVNGTK